MHLISKYCGGKKRLLANVSIPIGFAVVVVALVCVFRQGSEHKIRLQDAVGHVEDNRPDKTHV